MTNYVQVTASWTDGVNFAEGNYELIASGILMSSNAVAIVTPVLSGQLVAATPQMSVAVLASDNYGANELTWNFKIQLRGLSDIVVTDVPVLFSLGASQGLFGILEATGWLPPQT